MTRIQGRRALTCHHEAGHALVRWFFGYDTDRTVVLTIEELRSGRRIRNRRGFLMTCEGTVQGYDICGYPYGPLSVDGPPEEQAECDRIRAVARDIELINCLAGIYAEAAYRKMSVQSCMLAGGLGDMDHLQAILDAWRLNGEDRDLVTRTAETRASALVRSPQGAAAIRSIADTLIVRGRLSGDQIAARCRTAYGGRQCRFGAWLNRWPPTLAQIRAGFIPERIKRSSAIA